HHRGRKRAVDARRSGRPCPLWRPRLPDRGKPDAAGGCDGCDAVDPCRASDRDGGALMPGLSHFDSRGEAHMVDVSDKPITERVAIAAGHVRMAAETFEVVRRGDA